MTLQERAQVALKIVYKVSGVKEFDFDGPDPKDVSPETLWVTEEVAMVSMEKYSIETLQNVLRTVSAQPLWEA